MAEKSQTKRIVLLSGKAYYELVKERETRGLTDAVALIRLEELAPFPFAQLKDTLQSYGEDTEVVWFQEEPRNQGPYTHVAGRVVDVLEKLGRWNGRSLRYIGRKESAVPAPGVGKMYQEQQRGILTAAFEGL